MKPANQARVAALVLTGVFWGMTMLGVERFPPIHADEPWILSPGYKLFTQGVYGSDLFSGFNRMEELYLQFMPVFPVLQGAVVWLMGLGVVQMRYLPVVCGTLTLALTFTLARQFFSARVGVLALLLLLGWHLTPGSDPYLGSGVALVDIARLARYDILVAPLGLGAAWAMWHARSHQPLRYSALSGILAGLAGLTHIYGLIWVMVMLAWIWIDPVTRTARLKRTFMVLGLAGLVWLPWLIIVTTHWADFTAQMRVAADRLAFGQPDFYWTNVLTEARRYALGVRNPTTWLRPGFWLFVVGLPLALIHLSVRAWQRAWPARLWLIPTLLFPMLFALLLKPKNHTYLATLLPLYAVTLAYLGRLGWKHRRRWFALVLVVIVADGMLALTHLQGRVTQANSPTAFFRELRAALPATGRILGPYSYWVGLADRDYGYIGVAYLLAFPSTSPNPLPLDEALTQLHPDLMLIENEVRGLESATAPLARAWSEAFPVFMQAHQARLIGAVTDYAGQRVEIYQLEWSDP